MPQLIGSSGMVGAHDGGLDARVEASSARLRAVRVTTAARRLQGGGSLSERDKATLLQVTRDLREEARVLRGEAPADVREESAFALGSLTLTALVQASSASKSASDSADKLEALADEIDQLCAGQPTQEGINDVESLFTLASNLSSRSSGSSGERVDAYPEYAAP